MTLRISVRDLGPIGHGEIELRPLTVLVGPNNAGKSALATAAYAAMLWNGVMDDRSRRKLRSFASHNAMGTIQARDLGEDLLGAARALGRGEDPALSSDLTDLARQMVSAMVEDLCVSIRQETERAFGSRFADLARNGRRGTGSLGVSSDGAAWSARVRDVDGDPVFSTKPPENVAAILRHGRTIPQLHGGGDPGPDGLEQLILVGQPTGSGTTFAFLTVLDQLLGAGLFGEFPASTHYLPAARSGILQTYRALARNVIRGSALAGVRETVGPPMNGVVADFIGQLVALGPESSPVEFLPDDAASVTLTAVADALEERILAGQVRLVETPAGTQDIVYETGSVRLPLHRTSSMVAELAPLVLYLRHLLLPGDLLIIEEPEAHLHPESQARLAQELVRLTGQGLRVMLTTHSDLILQQINNSILAAELGDDPDAPEEIRALPRLAAQDVAAYLVRPDLENGSSVDRLEVEPGQGIPDEELARVAEALYQQTIKLNRRLLDDR